MSKRSSRRRRGKSRSRRSPSTSRSGAAARPARVERTTEVDLAVEYRYVFDDLKLIGIIAAVLIAGLVILSFFL